MKLANGFRIFRALYSVEARSAACTGIKSKYVPDYDPYGPRRPPSDKILNLAKSIAELPQEEQKMIGPLMLLKLMSPGYNITMTGGAGAASEAGEGAAAPVEEKAAEKSAFTVKLEKFDAAAKIKVIKEVRAFTNLGLKEAKDLVEKTPAVLKEGVTKEEGNAILEKIKAAGGVAVLE